MYRVAIVGSGPSGLYTAKYLLEHSSITCIHVIEQLCTPFGLIRYGVAPDHQEAKNVTKTLHDVLGNPRVKLFCNTSFGSSDLSMSTMSKHYSAVVFATGCSSERRLGISGEDSSGVLSSREFVNWYNGHPNANREHIASVLARTKRVVVVGQGNVAIDCARILVKDRADLASGDISPQALNVLSKMNMSSVELIGRRGHVQAAFTIKELRELSRLSTASVLVNEHELSLGLTPASRIELANSRPKTRIAELLSGLTGEADPLRTRISLRFLLQPTRILSDARGHVTGVEFERTRLEGEAGKQHSVSTGERHTIACDMVVTSLGYMSTALPDVPFDKASNTVPNVRGRVCVSSEKTSSAGIAMYVSGWLKRGPSGIIATNVTDAKETASSMVKDMNDGLWLPRSEEYFVPNAQAVTLDMYQRIDEEEIRRGRESNPPRPRLKLESVEEMLRVSRNVST